MTGVRQDEHSGRNTEQRASAVPRIARAVREHRVDAGLSLSELARRADIAKSTLSQVEAGQGNPGVETIWALATALGVSFSSLIDPPTPQFHVIRAGEGEATRAEDADYAATLLARCPPGARRDLFRIDAEPGRPRVSQPHARGIIEHVVLLRGRAHVGSEGDLVDLRPGDYCSYPGDRVHIFDATRAGTSAILISEAR